MVQLILCTMVNHHESSHIYYHLWAYVFFQPSSANFKDLIGKTRKKGRRFTRSFVILTILRATLIVFQDHTEYLADRLAPFSRESLWLCWFLEVPGRFSFLWLRYIGEQCDKIRLFRVYRGLCYPFFMGGSQKTIIRDPYWPTSTMESRRFFFSVAQCRCTTASTYSPRSWADWAVSFQGSIEDNWSVTGAYHYNLLQHWVGGAGVAAIALLDVDVVVFVLKDPVPCYGLVRGIRFMRQSSCSRFCTFEWCWTFDENSFPINYDIL